MATTWVVKGKKMVKEKKKGKKGPISELWISILLIMLSFIVTTLLSRLLKRLKSQ
jgi:nitrate/nitrite transporter NarK